MKQQDLQKLWEDRINRAKKKQKDWKDQFSVELARKYFAGDQNPGYPEQEWITINKIYSHLMAQLPTLYNVDPYFYVKVKKSYSPDPQQIALFEAKAKIRQSMLNYLKGELKLKPKARLGIQDAHFAYGVLKVRFAADEKENPDAGKEMIGENESPLVGDDGQPLLEPETIPVNERYEIRRIHPDDIIWDDDSGPLEDSWGFIAERVKMTKEDAAKDKRFNKAVVRSLQAKSREAAEKERKGVLNTVKDIFSHKPESKETTDVVVIWEIYDLKNKQWLTIAEDADRPLVMPERTPPGIEDHPYSILRFTLRDDDPYPIPPVSQAIGPQKEFCLSRSRIMTHRKRFNRKYLAIRNYLEDPDMDIPKLETGEDGTVIFAKTQGAVEPIKDAPLDQQNYLEVNALANDLTEIFGSPGESRGIAEADSATQAGILDKRLEVREGDRLSMVVDWITEAAKKLDQIIQANITRDEAIKITGPEGEFWNVVKATDYEEINGEFEYSVNVGAMTPNLPDIERSQWLAFMSQVVIPMPHILTAPHFMKKMAQMFHIEDDAALEELRQIGLQIMSGQVQAPGNTGSQKGQAEQDPVTAVLGSALGALGGNANGGGAPGGMG